MTMMSRSTAGGGVVAAWPAANSNERTTSTDSLYQAGRSLAIATRCTISENSDSHYFWYWPGRCAQVRRHRALAKIVAVTISEVKLEALMRRGGKVGLMNWVLGDKHFLEIPKGIIDLLQASMKDLREIVDIEQKFDILYSNFIELEEEIAIITVRDMYRDVEAVTDLFDRTQAITRRVGNLLSSARLYVDQVKHHISTLYPTDAAMKAKVEGYFHHEYDTLLGYRVMEALRNYSQHRGLPVHGMSYSADWVDEGKATERLECNASLSIFVKELRADGSFKASVIAELAALGKTIDLKPLIREYVEGLGKVHGKIRKLLDPRRMQAEELVLHWREQFRQHANLDNVPVGLVAGQMFKDGTAKESFALTDNSIVYTARLRARTLFLLNLSMRAVSTRKLVKKP